jgi:glycerol-3-phosphate dehydrogenase (NAD(P)+)
MNTIGVIGGGAWGTALAQTLSKGGRDVTLWAMEPEVVDGINQKHENPVFLPGVPLSPSLKATGDLQVVAKKDVILLVTPAQFTRSTLEKIKTNLDSARPIVICSKGIELETGKLLSQVAAQVVPDTPIAVLTGPTFAAEIARGLPSAVTIAAADRALALSLQETLGVKNFRPYITQDVIGTQLGGAIKNVIAIACGIVYGRKLGDSARAALLTRGIAEIARLGVAMGSQKDTLLGMCGVGDLMLTCSSMQSRNFSLGTALGEGKTIDEILGPRKSVTEGVFTAKSALALAKKHAVDMPITEAVNKCLNENMPIDAAIEEMLNRPFKYEMSKH